MGSADSDLQKLEEQLQMERAAREAAESELATKQHFLGSILDSATEISIIAKNLDRVILTWNEGARRNYGYSDEEVMGQHARMLHADRPAEIEAMDRLHNEALEKGVARGIFRRRRKDGSEFNAAVTLNRMADGDGNPTGYLLMSRDITAQETVEAELETTRTELAEKKRFLEDMLDSATESSIIAMTLDGNILTWNEGARRNYGYSDEEVIGQNSRMINVNTPEEAANLDRMEREAFEKGVATGQCRRLRKDGTEFVAAVTLNRMDDENGNSKGLLLMSRDITEELRIRRELEEMQNQLRQDIMELSTPVVQVWDKVLALPIIGTLDSTRTQNILETLLLEIGKQEAEVVILDVSGVPTVDTVVAHHLLKTANAARMMGATTVISGIRAEIAQSIVDIGVDLTGVHTKNKLHDALKLALKVVEGG